MGLRRPRIRAATAATPVVSILAVIARSESFSSLWPEMAAAAGAQAVVAESVGELGPAGDALALVLSVAGVEEEAEPLLRELAAAGAPAPLVVGARADHRLAVALVRAGA